MPIKHYIHNLTLTNTKFFSEEKMLEWVSKCGAFCFNGQHATKQEIAYAITNCPTNIDFGASLVTYKHVKASISLVEPHPIDSIILGSQLTKIKDRIQFLSDNVPKLNWMFLECELWAKYRESYKAEVLKRHTDVIEFIREKFPGIKITCYKFGSTVTRGWWLDIGKDTVYTLAENVDAWSVPFYSPSDLRTCRDQLDSTLASSHTYNNRGGVVPWISLGQQHEPINSSKWDLVDSDYNIKRSWALGQLINKNAYRDTDLSLARGHWGSIPVVYFYRPHTQFFEKHLDAYLSGL